MDNHRNTAEDLHNAQNTTNLITELFLTKIRQTKNKQNALTMANLKVGWSAFGVMLPEKILNNITVQKPTEPRLRQSNHEPNPMNDINRFKNRKSSSEITPKTSKFTESLNNSALSSNWQQFVLYPLVYS